MPGGTVAPVTGPGWQSQAGLVATFFERTLGSALGGVFVHGSAALGGWTPASDLDVLVTSRSADADWAGLGAELLSGLAPTPAVELSVVAAGAAARPEPPWPFLLHVNQEGHRVVLDGGQGDPDLLLHYLVAAASGVPVAGAPVNEAFGAVPRSAVLQHLRAELLWGLEGADQRYAVLNACRALAYGQDGLVLSKLDGGAWALARGLEPTLVRAALAAQRAGADLGPPTDGARAFVERCRAALGG